MTWLRLNWQNIANACAGAMLLLWSQGAGAQNPFAPVAIVNDEIITAFDVDQRQRLLALAGNRMDANSVLERLINDALRLQEAARGGLRVPDIEIQKAVAAVAGRSNVSVDGLRQNLAQQGIQLATLEQQLRAEIVWAELVRDRYKSRIAISDAEIDAELGRSASSGTLVEYRLSEILVPAPNDEAALKAMTQQIYADIRASSFADVARRISRAPSAPQGGDVGWVPETSLTPTMAQVVGRMEVGQVSAPVLSDGGVRLVQLVDSRVAGATQTLFELQQLVVPVSRTADQASADAALRRAEELRSQMTSCDQIAKLKAGLGPSSGDLGKLTANRIPGPLRHAVIALQVGEVTPPVRSNEGFHLVMLCGKSGGANEAERERIRNRLIEERLARAAEGMLDELRRSAVIDRR